MTQCPIFPWPILSTPQVGRLLELAIDIEAPRDHLEVSRLVGVGAITPDGEVTEEGHRLLFAAQWIQRERRHYTTLRKMELARSPRIRELRLYRCPLPEPAVDYQNLALAIYGRKGAPNASLWSRVAAVLVRTFHRKVPPAQHAIASLSTHWRAFKEVDPEGEQAPCLATEARRLVWLAEDQGILLEPGKIK